MIVQFVTYEGDSWKQKGLYGVHAPQCAPEDRLGDYNWICSEVFLYVHFMLWESLYGNFFICLDLCGSPTEHRLLPPFENVVVQFLQIFSVNSGWYQSKWWENLAFILLLNFSLISSPFELYFYFVLGITVNWSPRFWGRGGKTRN